MANFKKQLAESAHVAPADPRELFQRLPKPPGMNDLWETQGLVLQQWMTRRAERDLVLKLNTGGGKTLVGLLIARSRMNELRRPALYLCPTTQLVGQTVAKAQEVGIAAVAYQTGDNPLPSTFLNAQAILVGSYPALFNGRSKFGIRDAGEPIRVGCVVLDDAHAAFTTLRQQFTISISRPRYETLYHDLVGRFAPDFEGIMRGGTLQEVVRKLDGSVLDVPYWAWNEKAGAIRDLLIRNHAEEFRFQLPFLRDAFHTCHALVRSDEFVITPLHPLVDRLPTFDESKSRVYMSATIPDDSAIVRTFDASAGAVAHPIAPRSLAGVGERMILVPSLSGFDDEEALQVSKRIAADVARAAGVAVLVASTKDAERWKDIAIVVKDEAVAPAVEALVSRDVTKPVVFVNRYDGIDLVGDACRLLIFDGLPKGAGSYDLYRANVLRGNSSIDVGLATRVEQGLGRGTRGAGDYCAVLVIGRDLVTWLSRFESLELLSSATRAQVEIGYEISGTFSGESALRETIQQCLTRDPDWVRYHAETLADRTAADVRNEVGMTVNGRPTPSATATAPAAIVEPPLPVALRYAETERRYLAHFDAMRYGDALAAVELLAREHSQDRRYRGWLLQHAARAAHALGRSEHAKGLQREAHTANASLLRPPFDVTYEPLIDVGSQPRTIVSAIRQFRMPFGYLADLKQAVAPLNGMASSNQFEEALRRLGEFLGFAAERPDNDLRIGPDDLWLSDSFAFVLESKAGKDPAQPLSKDDLEQLLSSKVWFEQQYPSRSYTSAIVHHNALCERDAPATQISCLTLAALGRMVATLQQATMTLCEGAVSGATTDELERRCARLLLEGDLTADRIALKYFVRFSVDRGLTKATSSRAKP